MNKVSLEEVAKRILDSGAVEVRDVDAGEEPFVYSTGNRGPGYVMIKGLVGQPETLIFLVRQLALQVAAEATFDFIEGNATGGMVPAWQLRNEVSALLGREVPYAYLREARKEGGHGELITGTRNNPLIRPGMSVLVVEELVNYAGTTTNAARIYREAGYPVSHAACILSYDHAESNEKLREACVELVRLITLPTLIEVAQAAGFMPEKKAKSYRDFLVDPVGWQIVRGMVVPKDAAQTAKGRGFAMRELSVEEAVFKGAPESKVKQGVVYCAPELPSGATPMKPFIYVALDLADKDLLLQEAERLNAEVPGRGYGFKLNLDSMLDFSPGADAPHKLIEEMSWFGRPLFVDLKMWNGGRTMSRIAKGCADCGVAIINMYPHAMGNFVGKVAKALEGSGTKLFTLTVLTHYTDEDTRLLYGRGLGESVRMLADLGLKGGAHGIILPGTQLAAVRDLSVPKLVPAIRPTWYEDTKANDQEQAVTPEEAAAGGAEYLVIGSPILKAKDPAQALERILKEMEGMEAHQSEQR